METDQPQDIGSPGSFDGNLRATMTPIHEFSSTSGRTSPLFFLLKKKRTIDFCLKDDRLRSALEKLVAHQGQNPVHQVCEHLPVSSDINHPGSELVLEPGKEAFHHRAVLVSPSPVRLHRRLFSVSPGVFVDDGNETQISRERLEGRRVTAASAR